MSETSPQEARPLTAGDAMDLNQLFELGARAKAGEEITPHEQEVLRQFPPEAYLPFKKETK